MSLICIALCNPSVEVYAMEVYQPSSKSLCWPDFPYHPFCSVPYSHILVAINAAISRSADEIALPLSVLNMLPGSLINVELRQAKVDQVNCLRRILFMLNF